MDFQEKLRHVRIVPVIVIKDIRHAVPLARALVEGGLSILEVTLRTNQGLQAIKHIRAEVKDALVGAGSVLNGDQFVAATAAGAKFIVSPGLSEEVVYASRDHLVPILPGVATPSEIMRGINLGLRTFKFFPAEAMGGPLAIKAFAGPFAEVSFCPTGGVTPQTLSSYLSLSNVVAVGGSWMVPSALDEADAFDRAKAMAEQATGLARA